MQPKSTPPTPPTFTATGALGSVTWEPGKIEGDFAAVAAVNAVARTRVEVSLAGLWAGRAGLADHPAALATTLEAMPDAAITGDEIVWERLPDGAVASSAKAVK